MANLVLLTDFMLFLEEELLLNPGEVQPDIHFRSLRAWSSLNALIVISRINDETGIFISASDLANCQTVSDLHQMVQNKIHGAQ